MHFETHIQKLWWVFSYPQRRELTFIECLLLSDTEVEDWYTLFEVALSSPNFFSPHIASLHFSASLQVGMAMILSYGWWNLGERDAFHYVVPFHKNFPQVIYDVFIHLFVDGKWNYKNLESGSLMTMDNGSSTHEHTKDCCICEK